MRRRIAAALLGVLAVVGTSAPAWAAPSTEVVQGRVLRLVSVADWEAASSLSPGRPVDWDVTVSAAAPDPGRVTIGLSATGGAPLVVDVTMCLRDGEQGECPGGGTVLRSGWEIPLDGVEVDLAELADTDVARIRISVALAAGVHSGSTSVRFHAHGGSESVVVGPDGGLATTGLTSAAPWILGGGAALVAAGLVLIAVRRGRTTRRAAPTPTVVLVAVNGDEEGAT